jgi:hypothetical protein
MGFEGQSYFTRQRWAAPSFIGLSQELAILPAGRYELRFYAAAFGTNGDTSGTSTGYVTVNGTTTETSVTIEPSDPAAWNEYAVNFMQSTAGKVTIGVGSTKLADNFKTAYDHFTLTCLEKFATGVESATADDQVIRVEYYNLQGMRISAPVANGIYIVKKVFASQKVKTEKLFYKNK